MTTQDTTLLPLGKINAMFGPGLSMSASYISDTLGVPPRSTQKAAKLYNHSDVRSIGMALAQQALQVAASAPAEPTTIVIQPQVTHVTTDMLADDAMSRIEIMVMVMAEKAKRQLWHDLHKIEVAAHNGFEQANKMRTLAILRHIDPAFADALQNRLDQSP